MEKKPLICFDWDGTLADSMRLCIEECRAALLKTGLPDLPDETLMLCNGPTDWDACAILGVPDDSREAFVRIRAQAGLDLLETCNRLFDGAADMLCHLAPLADLAVVSNGQREYIAACLRFFGVEEYFVTTRSFTPGRVKAELLQDVLDTLQPERAVMVGDRAGDLNAGAICRIHTVAAAYGYGNDAEYALADVRADSIDDLERYLTDWCLNKA